MDKVRFLGFDEVVHREGGEDPRGILEHSEEYTIAKEHVGAHLTLIELEEVPGKVFNSEMFEDVIDE